MVRLDHLAIAVRNVALSKDWYVDNLALNIEFEIPEHKTVALKDDGDMTLFLHERASSEVRSSCTLTFQIDDVDAKFSELSARGVVFEKPPQKLLWGYGAELLDPDGYMVYLWDEKSMNEKGGV